MTTKHTPGPWNFHPCDAYATCFDVLCEKGYYVATTHDGVRGDRNADANARLIAAAPDLLEALQNIAEYWNQDQNEAAMADACWHAIHTARAAIAKATGDQP